MSSKLTVVRSDADRTNPSTPITDLNFITATSPCSISLLVTKSAYETINKIDIPINSEISPSKFESATTAKGSHATVAMIPIRDLDFLSIIPKS